ncbi:metabolite traffic protein EboE [Candidatus Levibacter sp. Uisw_134_01]|jgi:hypothetical protein|uniref:metabolite traffic protein EboE n=1 Tax=Candidatus Levibacter sp. Uisw_134_01 TaxID=3230999 RepID=UPI003D3E70AF
MLLKNQLNNSYLTYCTNIHAAEEWPDVITKLKLFLPKIKQDVSIDKKFGLGLRLAASAAKDLTKEENLYEFQNFLKETNSYVFTINGFPYGNFHGKPVKEGAYKPDWSDDLRLNYTNLLADHLSKLLPDEMEGSISTVPGTYKPWSQGNDGDEIIKKIIINILRHIAHLIIIKRSTGKKITLSLEPEPYCFLETISETISFFQNKLFSKESINFLSKLINLNAIDTEKALRFHLGICYDVCHAAVEFEDPKKSILDIQNAGIRITKLQLSSAIKIANVNKDTYEILKSLDEPVYMHQVVEKRGSVLKRFPDLSDAFKQIENSFGSEWRIHFHVPIFLKKMDNFDTTQDFLKDILRIHKQNPISQHLEVETYTWDVLPSQYKNTPVNKAIARELNWVIGELS